jgi:hypothetical protein
VASLLAAADAIRSQGSRLALPPLAQAIARLRTDHDAAPAMDAQAAATMARRLLTPLTSTEIELPGSVSA